MISNPNSVLYACVANGTTIVADFALNDPNLIALASQCLQYTPPHHSNYSHTVSGRTYHFLIDGKPNRPFVYFGIFDEALGKPEERVWCLNGVRDGFSDVLARNPELGIDDLSFRCFQDEMDLVFRRLLELRLSEFDDGVASSMKVIDRNVSSDSSCSSQLNAVKPLLGNPEAVVSSSRIRNGESNGVGRNRGKESKLDVQEFYDTDDGLIDGFSATKIGKDGNMDDTIVSYRERQKARSTWRKRVGLILLMDLFVCSLLFGVWLYICKGFECLSG
ncbi:unnamed protein product [Rhodiola kirilowii]